MTIVFRIPSRWRDVNLTVVSVPGKEVSLHECLADVYMVAEHVVLSRQGKNSAETACVWHRAESVFKVANTCVVLSAHVLALNDQTDFAFLGLSVFTFDLVVKPGRIFLSCGVREDRRTFTQHLRR